MMSSNPYPHDARNSQTYRIPMSLQCNILPVMEPMCMSSQWQAPGGYLPPGKQHPIHEPDYTPNSNDNPHNPGTTPGKSAVSTSKSPKQTPDEIPSEPKGQNASRSPPNPLTSSSPPPPLSRRVIPDLHALTRLEIEPKISIRDCLWFLSGAFVLESFIVSLGPPSSNEKPSKPSSGIIRSTVKVLEIKSSVNPRPLLEHLALPDLVDFQLNGSHGQLSLKKDLGLCTFLKNSKCRLFVLKLIDCYPKEDELINALRHDECMELDNLVVRSTTGFFILPSCRQRAIGSLTITALLEAKGEAPALCPRLGNLELNRCSTSISSHDFVNMVKFRLRFGLRRLDYAFEEQGTTSDEVARQLPELSYKHGLDVNSSLSRIVII